MKVSHGFKSPLGRNERYWITALLLCIATWGAYDFLGDMHDHMPVFHLVMEFTMSFLGFVGAITLVLRFMQLHERLETATSDAAAYKADALKWKQESAKFVQGLSQVIDHQFDRWSLTFAEKEIALLLLKGLSLKEISEIRNVSERTISHQTVSIYNKSGTNGRAALSAFFLEDLLSPNAIAVPTAPKPALSASHS